MLFTNWLTSTIIDSYYRLKQEQAKKQDEIGQVRVSLSSEFEIIKMKLIRNYKIFFKSLIHTMRVMFSKIRKNKINKK
jgi:hypothetical protein